MSEKINKSLKQRTISGVIWSAFDSLSGLIVQMICSLVVARLLTPADFGIVGMITVFSAIGLIIIDSGFGQALIRKQDATNIDFSSVFYFNLFVSAIIYGILYLSSPIIESFYQINDLSKISRAVFLIIPFNAIGLIQNTILTKQVDFKTLGIVSFLSALLSGTIGIILAYKTRSVWAIVYQTVSMYLIRTVLLWIISKWKPVRYFSMKSIKEMFPYAINLMLTGLFGTIVNNICPLIIGKIYNATQLGYFSQADKFQKLPSSTATNVIQRVTFPILVEIQDDNYRLRIAYSKILRQAVYIIAPIMIFLAVSAPLLFNIVLGSKWMVSAYYFQILCISGILYPVSCLSLNILNVKGNSKLLFYLEVFRKAVFLTIILISMFFSIDFFIWMQAVYSIVQLFINIYFSGKQIDFGIIPQLKVTFPLIILAFICCIPAVIVTYFSEVSNVLGICINLLSYLFTYILFSRLIKIDAYFECLDFAEKIKFIFKCH